MFAKPEFLRDFGFKATTQLVSNRTRIGPYNMHSRESTGPAGVPFVLVHGLVISSLYMIPLAESLAEHGSVIAVDLPGFGRTKPAPETLNIPELASVLIEWLEVRGIARCHLVANSLGCQIAAHVAVRAPERVQTLTLIGATIDPAAHSVVRQAWELVCDAWREPMRLWMNWVVDFVRAGLWRTLKTTRRMFADYIERQLPQITAPTLIIRGEHDPTMPERWGAEAARLVPSGRVVTIRGHSHCVHYTCAAEVSRLVREHASTFP